MYMYIYMGPLPTIQTCTGKTITYCNWKEGDTDLEKQKYRKTGSNNTKCGPSSPLAPMPFPSQYYLQPLDTS